MAPAAPLNVRSALHVKTVIWYFSVTAWRSSSKWEFEERNQLTSLRMWSDLNDCSYIRMHSWRIDSGFHTEMKSPALSRVERERIIMRRAAAQSCRCCVEYKWRPCLHPFGKKEPDLVWNYLKGSSAGTLNTLMLATQRARGWGCCDTADIRRNMSRAASLESSKHTAGTKASRCRQ